MRDSKFSGRQTVDTLKQATTKRESAEPEAAAGSALAELLGKEADDFREAADHVLRKNAELYRRLA